MTAGRSDAVTGPQAGPKARKRRGRLLLRFCLSLLFFLVLCEIGARIITRASDYGMLHIGKVPLLPFRPDPQQVRRWWADQARPEYLMRDPELGWTIAKSGKSNLYVANPQGFRGEPNRTYSVEVPSGKTRLLCVGDSFTHCDEVANPDTWEARLEKNRPDLEVMNLGVPGYGTDQALLRWRRDGRKFKAQFVILGIWPENLCRNLNVMRYYLNPGGAWHGDGFNPKPRFVLEGDRLQLVDEPVMSRDELIEAISSPARPPALQHEYWYRESEQAFPFYYHSRFVRVIASIWDTYERHRMRNRLYSNEDPAGNQITLAIAKQFDREVRENGSRPIILLIPHRDLLSQYSTDGSLPLVRQMREANLDVIDFSAPLADAVKRDGEAKYFLGHLSPNGNELLAQEIAKQIDHRAQATLKNQ